MPAWIHNRAERILSKNPDMDKGEAFAIATQQAHALGKSPKGYGTSEGRAEAHRKYRTPQDDQKTASVMWSAFFSEAEKLGAAIPGFKSFSLPKTQMPLMPKIPGRIGSTRMMSPRPPTTPGHMPQAPAPATPTISHAPGSTLAPTARSVGGSGGM